MDHGLHVKQGLNHLQRVLDYAPFVAEDGRATVHLTFEDWHVLADTLFHMDTPRELLPDQVSDVQFDEAGQKIEVTTQDLRIAVEKM
jgi:hypothetical protein